MHGMTRKTLASVRNVVVKLGTQLLSDPRPRDPGGAGQLDGAYLATMARQVAELHKRGVRVTVVSSGAIGAGVRQLKLPRRPTDLAMLQAVAAVGQRKLMDAWAEAFAPFDLAVAQLLLTRDDFQSRTRYLNLRNTIHAVQQLGAIPIINENDTVSTDELVKITFGDNDILAAAVTHAMNAQLLVLLTVVDGIQDEKGQAVRFIADVEQAKTLVRAEKSALGKGGMSSKLQAARMVAEAGEVLVVADGRMEDVLLRLLAGEEVGTVFAPAKAKLSSRSRWIGSLRPVGTIVVDEGCAKALLERNRSLLPAGIVEVRGDFDRGDVVAIAEQGGRVIAQGLSNYPASTIATIKGRKTAEVRAMLKESSYDEVVHRDNLVKC